MNIEHLQGLINKRAENRLNEDLKKLSNLIESNRLLRGFDGYSPKLCIQNKKAGEDATYSQPDTLDRLLNSHWGELRKQIYDNFLPVYIGEESLSFVKKIEEIEDTVSDLLNNQNYQS